jgi:hypothetical protein
MRRRLRPENGGKKTEIAEIWAEKTEISTEIAETETGIAEFRKLRTEQAEKRSM